MPTRKQRGVLAGMAAGLIATILVLSLPPLPILAPPTADIAAHLAYAARAAAIAMLWLLAAVANVARARFFSAPDIDGMGFAPASPRLAPDIAIVQNTLEQAVLAAALYFALATLRAPDLTAMIPPLLTLFCIGRAAFWLGYRHGAPWRAFGFATTFYPTVFGYLVVASRLLFSPAPLG
jgi:hypothetical protein